MTSARVAGSAAALAALATFAVFHSGHLFGEVDEKGTARTPIAAALVGAPLVACAVGMFSRRRGPALAAAILMAGIAVLPLGFVAVVGLLFSGLSGDTITPLSLLGLAACLAALLVSSVAALVASVPSGARTDVFSIGGSILVVYAVGAGICWSVLY